MSGSLLRLSQGSRLSSSPKPLTPLTSLSQAPYKLSQASHKPLTLHKPLEALWVFGSISGVSGCPWEPLRALCGASASHKLLPSLSQGSHKALTKKSNSHARNMMKMIAKGFLLCERDFVFLTRISIGFLLSEKDFNRVCLL